MASIYIPKYIYSYIPPKNPLKVALSNLYSIPLPIIINKVKFKELKAQALILEFKKVNEVYIYTRL
jgi:hypothetical protein